MAVRKSKYVGKIVKGFNVLDSRRKGRDTEVQLKCLNCNSVFWKSRGFLKQKAKCPCCQGGRNYRNAKGYTHEKLYQRYRNILRRVKDPTRYYGVTICEEWENDYLSFREWALNNGYDDSLTIDRIDNNKGYQPDNCRWATVKEQANNRRSNRLIEYENKRYTISEFADVINLPYTTVEQRIKNGWAIEDVVKTPYKSKKRWSEINKQAKTKSR
jgi:hypothetical protein